MIDKKFPKYVYVYNDLLKLINSGLYPRGSKLPPENDMAKEMNVSRMTLRQAISLLKEDGIVETIQGAGNFIRKTASGRQIGFEKMSNPIYKLGIGNVENTHTKMRINTSMEYTNKIFNRKLAVVVDFWSFYRADKCNALAYSMIPIDTVDRLELELNNESCIKNFLEKEMYSIAYKSNLEFKCVDINDQIRDAKIVSSIGKFLLICESIYNAKGELLVYTKYYLPIEAFNFQIDCFE